MTRIFEGLSNQERPGSEQRQSSDVHTNSCEALISEEGHQSKSSLERGAGGKFVSSRTASFSFRQYWRYEFRAKGETSDWLVTHSAYNGRRRILHASASQQD